MISLEKISRSEWVWVVVVSVLFVSLINLPYLYGWLHTPAGSFFTGMTTISHYDTYTYLAWFEQARQGNFFFVNLYSTELQSALFFHPFFYVLGVLGHFSTLSNIVIYHVGKMFVGMLFLSSLYLFISDFIKNVTARQLTFVITIVSSGVGLFLSPLSTDMWMVESNTFLSLYMSPLNLISLTLILLIFHISTNLFHSSRRMVVLLPALLLGVLVIIHPYDLAIVTSVLFVYVLVQTFKTKNYFWLRNYLYLIILVLPFALWQVNILNINPVLGVWATIQTNVPSHAWYYFLSGYGFLLVFAFVGISNMSINKDIQRILFLLIWILVIPFLLYFPLLVRFQRKFSEGLHIPIAILASMGLVWFLQESGLKNKLLKHFVVLSLISLLALTNVWRLYQDMQFFKAGEPPFYLDEGIYAGAIWLKHNTEPKSIVISSLVSSNIIPGIAGRKVFVGTGDQTLDYGLKSEIVTGMLGSKINNSDPLKFFLRQEDIDYIFEDADVRLLGGLDTTARHYLRVVYENSDVKIYQVDQNNLD